MDITGLKSKAGVALFKPRAFLSINEVTSSLTKYAELKNISEGDIDMIKNSKNVNLEEFLKTQKTFHVTNLQHVTNQQGLIKIIECEGFKGGDLDLRSYVDVGEESCLSWWSADPPLADFTPWCDGPLEKQFSPSPAFDAEASMFGNFKFSFSLSDLLSAYQAQHCRGGEPQLRVLGTKMFKYEIAHVVLVHSPDTELFSDIPLVPSEQQNTECHLPVVYQKERGELVWTPESKGSELRIGKESAADGHPFYSVWNHLEVAFHLPKAGYLSFSTSQLLKSLTPCDIREPYLQAAGTGVPRRQAEHMVELLQRKYSELEKPENEDPKASLDYAGENSPESPAQSVRSEEVESQEG